SAAATHTIKKAGKKTSLPGNDIATVSDAFHAMVAALGHEDSAQDESFAEGLLEYPHYTRPEVFRDMRVPEILLSGDHAKIAAWRRQQSLERTKAWRPDLLTTNDPDPQG
ncbi:MAG TPA: hypothetical protein PLT20_01315, partial [Sedimentisphaerales bacterium]|nr:hypothetical protein [Sedimentisphaerales bacterium]